MTRKFDLNIEKILENWEKYHAIREFIANALDESILSHSSPIKIYEENGIWHIRDYGRGLQYKHFTQNENYEKLNNPNVIGKFGIGLKDALATLYRYGAVIEIKSKYGIYEIEKSNKQDFDDILTLHAVVTDPEDTDFQGTDITIYGVNEYDINKAKSLFLYFKDPDIIDTTKHGQIIRSEQLKSSIYLNGIQIAEEENFLFSYNITAPTLILKKSINRERTTVGRSAYSDIVKKILLNSTHEEVISLLKDEIVKTEKGTQRDELKWIGIQEYAIKILNTSNDFLFLSTQQLIDNPDIVDEAKDNGKKILQIPENLLTKIQSSQDIKGNPISDFNGFLNQLDDEYEVEYVSEEELNDNEKQIFGLTNQILELVNLTTGNRDIKIVKNLRLNTNGLCTLFEILIKRSRLSSLEQYADTLIHEAIHAHYDVRDISRDFELCLSSIIGDLTAKYFYKKENPVKILNNQNLDYKITSKDSSILKEADVSKSNNEKNSINDDNPKTINNLLHNYKYRECIKFEGDSFISIMNELKPSFYSINGSLKRALFFYVLAPEIPEDKYYFFNKILSESYKEYLRRRIQCKAYSNIKDTCKNMEIIFSLPLLSHEEYSQITHPILCKYDIYKSLKEIAKKRSIILNYHFIYNVLTMRMPEGWYYQYSGTIREIDSIYNEYKDLYEKIEQKFIQ